MTPQYSTQPPVCKICHEVIPRRPGEANWHYFKLTICQRWHDKKTPTCASISRKLAAVKRPKVYKKKLYGGECEPVYCKVCGEFIPRGEEEYAYYYRKRSVCNPEFDKKEKTCLSRKNELKPPREPKVKEVKVVIPKPEKVKKKKVIIDYSIPRTGDIPSINSCPYERSGCKILSPEEIAAIAHRITPLHAIRSDGLDNIRRMGFE